MLLLCYINKPVRKKWKHTQKYAEQNLRKDYQKFIAAGSKLIFFFLLSHIFSLKSMYYTMREKQAS